MTATADHPAPAAEWTTLLRRIPSYDPLASAGGCWFDPGSAARALDFFPECLRHVKGELAGKPLNLEPWQRAVIGNIFGWKRQDGRRRYREVFVYVPRKNGKTTLVAGIPLYMLFCDGEMGAEVYAAAAEREQASIIFDLSKEMMLAEPELESRGKVYRALKSIVCEETASTYKAISADADTKHGFNSHCFVVDELHAQPNRHLVDVLTTSTGSRAQPLAVYITTADFDRVSICNEKHEYARKVRDGIINDSSFLPVIFEAEGGDDWQSPKTWRKANPNLGVSISEEYLARECQRAKDSPAYENTFKRLHLNMKTQQDVRWLQLDKWDACAGDVDPAELAGHACYAGLDLASTTDLAAFLLLFQIGSRNVLLPYFWSPRANAERRQNRDRVPYMTWANQGRVKLTEGDVIDFDVIRADVNAIGAQYQIKEIAIDRWNSTQLQTQLMADEFVVVPFGQGFSSMAAPTKEFERLVIGRQIEHGGNPVLRWMASNVAVETDAAGNMKPSKKKSTEKIDGIVAAVMALGRAMVGDTSGSVYDSGGIKQL